MADLCLSGAASARRDIDAGVLRYKWIGHGGLGGKEFCRIISERFGMEVDDFGICLVSQDKVSFAEEYNAIVSEHIAQIHGRDVIAEALTESRATSNEDYQRSLETEDDSA